MCPDQSLVDRVRGEFLEMPGLRLTLPQASRLWQMDRDECEAVLESLVVEQFLARTSDGAFIKLPTPRGRTAKASLSDSQGPRRFA